ncbi:hypothetical protein EAF04_003533 [Stromatinia cepivora]|nr:hypothetical protein EAF04_003533 [Stromatinia cepivora]
MFDVTLTPSMDPLGSELSKEKLPSYSSTGCLSETDKFEELRLDDHKDNNEDICNEAARASTGWTNEWETTITPPRRAHLPDGKEFVPGLDDGTTGTMESAEPERPNEQASRPYSHYCAGLNNLEESLDRTQDNAHGFSDTASQNSTWWSARWSTTWAYAFGSAIPPPSQVYFPDEKTHNTTPSNLDRNISLTGRKANNGFDKTKKLLADQLMNRVTSMNGSRCRTQASSSEDLSQDRRNLYEEAAEAFIEYVKNLILQSEGPNQRVDDWMVMGFIDKAYTVPENGEKKTISVWRMGVSLVD